MFTGPAMKELPRSMPLFRPEALESKRSQLFGDVLLPTPNSIKKLTIGTAISLLLLVALSIFGSVTRRVDAVGWVEYWPQAAEIKSNRSGVITDILVKEGEAVSPGQPIVALASQRSSRIVSDIDSFNVQNLESRKRQLLERVASVRALAAYERSKLERSIEGYRRELVRLKERFQLNADKIQIAQADFDRKSELRKTGLISQIDMESARSQLLDAKSQALDIQQQTEGATIALHAALDDLRALPMNSDLQAADLEAQAQIVDRQLVDAFEQQDATISSPIAGTVTAIVSAVGSSVSIGELIVTIIPAGAELRAELVVPSRAAGFLREGMPLLIRYDAYPYQKYGQHHASIESVSKTIIPPEDQKGPIRLSDPAYRVIAALSEERIEAYGTSIQLRRGMTFKAKITQEKKRIFQWIFDPLLAAGQ